jgi:hypothetical protein
MVKYRRMAILTLAELKEFKRIWGIIYILPYEPVERWVATLNTFKHRKLKSL